MADISNTTPLIPPSPMIKPNFIDLEASTSNNIQCRICLESEGGEFIAPCKCKGSSKFVHRECLDHWRSVKSMCNCANRHSRALIVCGTMVPSPPLFSLIYCIEMKSQGPYANVIVCPCRASANSYFPGTYYMWSDGGGGCCDIGHCCEGGASSGDQCGCCGEGCCEGGTNAAGDCGSCAGDSGEGGLPLVFIMALIVVVIFAVVGIFYSVLVATMVGQRIWQRHYHILAKRILTKARAIEALRQYCRGRELYISAFDNSFFSYTSPVLPVLISGEYVVEDVDGKRTSSDWSPPTLPAEHVEQLKTLGLL
ncbi:hypothetical protein KSS87_015651 [Heliosperma pusillum]|nr:hypothetical protein KSS87_015651 [Heliosperma pusillum]